MVVPNGATNQMEFKVSKYFVNNLWSAYFDQSKNLKTFKVFAMNKKTAKTVIILEGKNSDFTLNEMKRARDLTYRFVDVMNIVETSK